jgi:predicted XRE-type DNA-binding protein
LMRSCRLAQGGNVFRDLGFDEAEAEHLQIRSTLMIAVRKAIEALIPS